jgi:hypothetical protein
VVKTQILTTTGDKPRACSYIIRQNTCNAIAQVEATALKKNIHSEGGPDTPGSLREALIAMTIHLSTTPTGL